MANIPGQSDDFSYDDLRKSNKGAQELKKKPMLNLISSLILILVCLGLIGGSFFYFNSKKTDLVYQTADIQSKIDTLKKEIDKKEEFSKTTDSLLKMVEIVDFIYNKENKLSSLFKAVEYLLPENIFIQNGIDIANFKVIKLTASTESLENIANFKDTVEKSGLFGMKGVNSITLEKGDEATGEKSSYGFSSELTFMGDNIEKSEFFVEKNKQEVEKNKAIDSKNKKTLEKTVSYLEAFKEKTGIYPCSNITKMNNNFLYYLNVDGLSSDKNKEFAILNSNVNTNNLGSLFIVNNIMTRSDFSDVYGSKDFSSVYIVNRSCDSYALCSKKRNITKDEDIANSSSGVTVAPSSSTSTGANLPSGVSFSDEKNELLFKAGTNTVYDENLCNFIR